ncbi:Uncharacterized protein APZ42_005702 [Daphnia magna]|uniref:Uncharacterized protein n=1 Tax=Daphnia magna TaxID=35525 RepID=A0A162CSX9_9CRUS|nr:Uncharacterized protein APZ42_005702 [Daphnia magna]
MMVTTRLGLGKICFIFSMEAYLMFFTPLFMNRVVPIFIKMLDLYCY